MWEFFEHGKSKLDLDQKTLAQVHRALDLKHVSREQGLLEYVFVQTYAPLAYRIYEDGLIILERDISASLKKDAASIKEYLRRPPIQGALLYL